MTYTKKLLVIFNLIGIICLTTSCNSVEKSGEYLNTPLYDLTNPTIVNLPPDLDEISGIAYYPKDTSVFAVIDEDGILFKVPILHPNNTKKWQFDKQRDFEDIVLRDSIFYALVSNGDVVAIKFNGDSIHTDKTDFSDNSKKVDEFETLYMVDSGKLVIMCKQCEADKKAKVSAFALNDTNATYSPHLVIDASPVAEKLKEDKIAIKPSAAAINPMNGDLYVLSSVAKLLIIFDAGGKFKELYKLNPKLYKQPEGLTFTPAGDMIISNEVFLEGYANLLIFKNKKKGQ